jgi:V/A-type H+-transporting ATPase subunit I
MRKLRVLILDEFVENVLTAIQLHGKTHVVDIRDSLTRWENLPEPCDTELEKNRWQSVRERIEVILFDLGLKRELGLLEQLFKPDERSPIEVSSEQEIKLLTEAEEIVKTVENEIEEKIKRFRLVRELLIEMRGAKIDIEDLRSTETLYIKFGKMAGDEIPTLENELKSRIGLVSTYTSGKKRIKFMALVSVAKFSEEIDKIMAGYKFQEIQIPKELSGEPSSSLRLLDSQLSNILKTHQSQTLSLYDAVLAKIERLNAKGKMGRTARIFILQAWVPEREKEEIQTLIAEAAHGNATVSVLPADAPESEIPTLLAGRKMLGNFRILTEMYGMPMYNEIDPTPFLAVFFTFFVGLMSADLAIGTTVIIASLFIRRGAGSRSEGMKNLSVILLCIGMSSIFFGILMGEFMGGVVKLPVLWISAADNPIDFLFIVIGIGMAHVIFGAILGFFNNFHKREFRKMAGDQLSTVLLIGAAAIILLTGRFDFEGIGVAAYSMGIVGLVTLIGGKGFTGMLELTRLLSNVISYVRILALNMATAWMSRTFVLLGGLLIDVYLVGPVLNGIILLFSHFFIVFISTFATFAHGLRLHYVEFFGRFFIGGGTKFSPLSSERKNTVIRTASEKVAMKEEAEKQLG